MNIASFTLLLVLLGSSTQVIILQSSMLTTIVSPAGAATAVSVYFNGLKGGIAGDGVSWIQRSSPAIGTTVYRNLFYANCVGSASLIITASTSFTAYLDGVLVGRGSDYSKPFTFPIKISCGNHNFTVSVSAATLPSGLTFSINQDQSKCFKCQASGFWSEHKCSCLCINQLVGCTCPSPKVWKAYPTCGCGCRNSFIKVPLGLAEKNTDTLHPSTAPSPAPITVSTASLAVFNLCLAPKYYSQNSCKCVCHYKYCGPRKYFDEDTCSCWDYIY